MPTGGRRSKDGEFGLSFFRFYYSPKFLAKSTAIINNRILGINNKYERRWDENEPIYI